MTVNSPTRITFKAGEFLVDPELQRRLDVERVSKIAAKFDPTKLGVLSLSRRSDGRTYIVDGQHRNEAAVETKYDGEMEGNLYVGLTTAEEADLFLGLNDTKRATPIDTFRLRVQAGDPVAVGAKRIAEKHGWKIHYGRADGYLSAAAAIQTIYSMDNGAALDKVLALVTHAWGNKQEGVNGNLMIGVALFLERYGPLVNVGSLADKLNKYPGGPGALLGAGRAFATLRRVRVSSAVAEHLVDTYNSYKPESGRLAAWR